MTKALPELPDTDADNHYEIIDGERTGLPPMAYRSARIAAELTATLVLFCREHRCGRVTAEGRFAIPAPNDPGRARQPDVAYVSFTRWPADRPEDDFDDVWPVVPELVVEILSPTDRIRDLLVKLRDYFAAGVRRVWVIDPAERVAWEYTGRTQSRSLGEDDALDGGDALPGFTLRLGDLLAMPNG